MTVHLRPARVLALAGAVLCAAAARNAAAAACCMSATSFGVGRLLVWEDAAVGVQLNHARVLGQYGADGVLRSQPAGYSEGVSQILTWGIVRLGERLQVQAWVPVIVNDRSQDSTRQLAGGLGDVGAAVRWDVVAIGEYAGLPSFAVTAGVVGPTGRRIEDTDPPLFAGATGRGAWGGSLAVEGEYALLPWFVRLEAGVTAFAPFVRDDLGVRQQFAPLVQATLSAGRELSPDRLVVAIALTGEWQGDLTIGGATVPASDARSVSGCLSASWRVVPRWTLLAVATTTVMPDRAAVNRDARLGITLGARYGIF